MNPPIRSIATAIILSFITCGLYSIVWYYTLAKDLQDVTGRYETSASVEILLLFVTCGLYSFYFLYKYGRLVCEAQQMRGLPVRDNSLLLILLNLFGLGLVSLAILQSDVNALAQGYSV